MKLYPLPRDLRGANLNTPVMDHSGIVWFTGQNGVHGRVDPKTGKVEAWRSPRRGTYGITVTPSNEVWYAALAGDHLGHVNRNTGEVEIVEPPRKGFGPRRVWSKWLSRRTTTCSAAAMARAFRMALLGNRPSGQGPAASAICGEARFGPRCRWGKIR